MAEIDSLRSSLDRSREQDHENARQLAKPYLDIGEFVLVTIDTSDQAHVDMHSTDLAEVKKRQEELAAEESENDPEEEGDYKKIILLVPERKVKTNIAS